MIEFYCDDAIEGMKTIPDKTINMICADLPYQTTQNKWDVIIPFNELWEQYERIIKDTGVIVLFGQQPFTTKLISSNYDLFRYTYIWEKSQSTGFLNAKKMPMKKTEDIVVFYKKLPTYNPQLVKKDPRNIRTVSNASNKSNNYGDYESGNFREIPINMTYPNNILRFNNSQRGVHETEKPEPLVSYLIKTYTNENDLVLDNCYGSGTTGISCYLLNRNFIGFDNREKCRVDAMKWLSSYINNPRMC